MAIPAIMFTILTTGSEKKTFKVRKGAKIRNRYKKTFKVSYIEYI